MNSTYLTTDRFLLRTMDQSDLSDLVKLDSYPEVMQFISDGKPSTLDYWQNTALPTILGYYKRYNYEFGNWIVIDRVTKEFVGWFHLRPDKQNLGNTKELELGYRLMPTYWGKGIATEISLGLIEKAFQELSAEKVIAKAMKGNKNSIRVMEKVGMHFDSIYIENEFPGENKEAARYSISKSELS